MIGPLVGADPGGLMDNEWMLEGNCRNYPPSMFFPSDGVGVDIARKLCHLPGQGTLPRVRAGRAHRSRGLGWMFGAGASRRILKRAAKSFSRRCRRPIGERRVRATRTAGRSPQHEERAGVGSHHDSSCHTNRWTVSTARRTGLVPERPPDQAVCGRGSPVRGASSGSGSSLVPDSNSLLASPSDRASFGSLAPRRAAPRSAG